MSKRTKADSDDLRAEYDADFFRGMKPSPYADRPKLGRVRSVVLDPDVAEVFHSSDDVNAFLRSAIKTMPPRRRGEMKSGAKRRAG
jgi:hypothetical protein